jgi:hypothetical protein
MKDSMILIAGLYNVLFAIFHLCFWKLFKWRTELTKLGFPNKGIMQVLNIQLMFYFLFVTFICFAFRTELQTTRLGHAFLLGNSLFWFIRTINQFIFLRAKNTTNHISTIIFVFLTIIFILGTIIFAIPLIN